MPVFSKIAIPSDDEISEPDFSWSPAPRSDLEDPLDDMEVVLE